MCKDNISYQYPTSHRFTDLSGQAFSRLTVISFSHTQNGRTHWKCMCVCGTPIICVSQNLKNGHTQSCGCLHKEATSLARKIHGLSGRHPLYGVWSGIKQRCYNINNKAYKYYGAKGITVCEEWKDFNAFYNWSINNGWKQGLDIDRADYKGNYEPSNCRFITEQVGGQNRSKVILNNKKASEIRQLFSEGNTSRTELAKIFGVGNSNIEKVINRLIWR